ncbi:MAG: MFS transporter, partial [Methanobrevibacter sp.]|nr:MFS transporter [Methanobrevibacter sp.]
MDRFEKSVICVGALTSFFGVFLASAVSIALPDIGAEFGMTDVAQNYVTLTFLLAVAALTIPAGFVSGKFGVRKMMCFGIAVYVISSIVAIFSISQEMFIACRLFQGLGCAFLDVGSIALVTCAFEPEVRGKALGLTVVGAYLATSLAAPLGGFLNTMWGWRSIFCFGVPFLAICLILLVTVINKEWSEYANIPIDIKGCVLYVIGIVLAIFGFTMLTEPFGLIVMIIGILLIVVFILVELRVKFPAFDVRLFKNPKFASANFAALSGYLATMAITTIIN